VSDQSTVPHRFVGLPIKSLSVRVEEGVDRGKSYLADRETLSIGTAPGNDLLLTDETVSRYHLELARKQDRIHVRDCGSTNGIQLGNAFLESATIQPGTLLALGKTTIRIEDGETVDLELVDDDRLGPIRGRTAEMRSLMARIERAAKTDVSVLLLGETGVGKEVIARAIHESSPRMDHPFEVVDCGALMPTLIASELFGHEKGAFTGADRQHVGAFERANGGTLFLDEIGELPPTLQSALLGALERRSFRRVGGTQSIGVDVRVVCATNRDLRNEVNAGRFRQDLYYRIAVVLLRIPPLRERTGDIPLLVEHFLREIGHDGSVEEMIPETVMQTLKTHHWPGNVRELRNFVEAAVAMGEAPHLEDQLERAEGGSSGMFTAESLSRLVELSYKDARSALLNEFEVIYLKELMERTKHNVSAAARGAKMNRSYLIQMLKRHGIR
jgi:DNA-binding NtrC family response regulator